MFPLRIALLALTLGLATLVGWGTHSVLPSVESGHDAHLVQGPLIHPFDTNAHGDMPARKGTEPDPTSDDSGPSVNVSNPGSHMVVQGPLSQSAAIDLIASAPAAWSEPARYDPLLLLTRRFRF
jgi:hypothetical protein